MPQPRSRTRKSPAKKSGAKRTTKRTTGGGRAASARSDKSVQAFRDALDRSVTLSRDRIQEVVDDAVKRGRMTRGDANELVSNLVSRGRKQTEDLLKDLERLLEPARRRAAASAGRVGRAARDAADRPLAEADRLRRRAGGPGAPISAYDQLTASQVKSRLGGLTKAQLRKVRTQEKRGKARKSILADIETRLK